jgi:GntR family transcriptional regulator, transcriptional repressor for pyruvate dehydrogenase complex
VRKARLALRLDGVTVLEPRDLQLGDIDVPRASAVLAERLRRKILEKELPPGTTLPPERELADQSGLSRGSVRDALRVLELEGLVEIRPGRGGGTIVRRPDGTSLHRTLATFIRGRQIQFRSILEVRELMEPECAALAAERRTAEDLDRLRELTERLRAQGHDVQAFLTTNAEWHVAVAGASGNELYEAFMYAIAQEIREATDVEGLNTEDVISRALEAHDRIIHAIEAGDSSAARTSMRRHVCAYRDIVMERRVLGETTRSGEDRG